MSTLNGAYFNRHFRRIMAMPRVVLTDLDMEAITRATVKSLGVPESALRTPEQMVAFRKRSASAKLGWVTRKKSLKRKTVSAS